MAHMAPPEHGNGNNGKETPPTTGRKNTDILMNESSISLTLGDMVLCLSHRGIAV